MDDEITSSTRSVGDDHETMALEYLLGRGYHLLQRNFRFGRMGEIDLVMRDGEFFVFVEVKSRRSHTFGVPEESLTPQKRYRIRRVAEGFFLVRKIEQYSARFDVVAIDYVTGTAGRPEIRHYVNAF